MGKKKYPKGTKWLSRHSDGQSFPVLPKGRKENLPTGLKQVTASPTSDKVIIPDEETAIPLVEEGLFGDEILEVEKYKEKMNEGKLDRFIKRIRGIDGVEKIEGALDRTKEGLDRRDEER